MFNLPQLPQLEAAKANHVVYGMAAFIVANFAAQMLGFDMHRAAALAASVVVGILQARQEGETGPITALLKASVYTAVGGGLGWAASL